MLYESIIICFIQTCKNVYCLRGCSYKPGSPTLAGWLAFNGTRPRFTYSFDIFLKLHSYGSGPARLGETRLNEARSRQTALDMTRLRMLMFIVLTSKWKIGETIPPKANVTAAITDNNVTIIQCFNV